jgi:hypothetical protein
MKTISIPEIKLPATTIFVSGHVYHPSHGPQVWPWWKLISWKFVRKAVQPPSTGYGLWVYTRWGAVTPIEIYFDRR